MNSSRDIVRRLRENRILAERKNYESMERNELIKLAQDGDQLAIETLVNTHQDFINKMSHKYFLDTGDKDDVKQLVTIAFWNAIQSWNMTGDFEAYAGMIIKRKMTDELRKEEAGKSKINTDSDSLDRPVADDGEGGELNLGASIQSKDLSPEEQYLGVEGARKITKFMAEELSDLEKRVITLYIEGYKVSEIAEVENVKYKKAENAIKRVKDKLAEYLRNVRESRSVRLSEESIFSDEEKQILKSVLGKLDERKSLKESLASKDVEEYTDEEFERSLNDIEAEADEIKYDIQSTTSEEEYHDLLSRVDDLKDIVLSYEDVLEVDDTSYLFNRCKEIYRALTNIEYLEPENLKSRDPYDEVGMKRSDF